MGLYYAITEVDLPKIATQSVGFVEKTNPVGAAPLRNTVRRRRRYNEAE